MKKYRVEVKMVLKEIYEIEAESEEAALEAAHEYADPEEIDSVDYNIVDEMEVSTDQTKRFPVIGGEFASDQLKQINLGREHGLSPDQIMAYSQISVYRTPVFTAAQMEQIRLALESGIDTDTVMFGIAWPGFTHLDMEQVRLGFEHGLTKSAVKIYTRTYFSDHEEYPVYRHPQMEQIRLALEHGIAEGEVFEAIDERMSASEMKEIRLEAEASLEGRKENLSCENIRKIQYRETEYSNFGHEKRHLLSAWILGMNYWINYEVIRHDGDEESFTIHTAPWLPYDEVIDVWDIMSEPELKKLEKKLSDEVRIGQYITKITNATTLNDLQNIEYGFMEDETFPRRLIGRYSAAMNARRIELGGEPPEKEDVFGEAAEAIRSDDYEVTPDQVERHVKQSMEAEDEDELE
ncbi:MAG: hypothetical protein K5897_08060 [Eubacterium sp.]|nr:hypothetical protein [Eubacterium sp.]